MKSKKSTLCKCHPDFHLPASVTVGNCFDGRAYAAKAKLSGIDSLVIFAKCHYGFSYYNTAVGTVHPGLVKDMVDEFVNGCRDEGLESACYLSVFLDTAAGKKHPEWVMRPGDRSFDDVLKDKYLPICVNSGYLKELLIPQVLEILDRYAIDELFFDTMSDFHPCYCENCRRLFGHEIPHTSTDPFWRDYVQWYYKRYELFFSQLLEAIQTKDQSVNAVINWKWSATMPEDPMKQIKRLVGDLFTSGSVSSYFAHYWAGTRYPFDYMCGRFLHGLGDWSNSTPETLKYTAASTIANGGGFYLIDRQMPDGCMENRAYSIMKDVFGFINQRRDMVEGTVHVPETAVLHSLEHIVGPDFQYFPDIAERSHRMCQILGISKIFINRAIHYTALNATVAEEHLNSYQVLVLPETDYISSSLKKKIVMFVNEGGKLLIIQGGCRDAIDQDLLDLAGIDYCGPSMLEYSYIARSTNGFADPLLVRGYSAVIEPRQGTCVLTHFVEPLLAGSGHKDFGHGFAPPTGKASSTAVTLRTVGQGEVMFVAAPLLSSYETYPNPHIADYVTELYQRLYPRPLVLVDGPRQLEMTAVRRENNLIVHLVNHNGKEIFAGKGKGYRFVEYIPEIRNIYISIRDASPDGIRSVPNGVIDQSWLANGYLVIRLDSLHIMNSICLPGYYT